MPNHSPSSLASLLQSSDLSEAGEALTALGEGWKVEKTASSVACSELLGTYEVRQRHVALIKTNHFERLARSIAELVNRLKQHPSDRALLYVVKDSSEHHFLIFLVEGTDHVLGCLRVVSNVAHEHIFHA